MKEIVCKLLVIGAGPGGYVCAIRAGQLGVDTVIVEKTKAGGTCLNVGCIPSKALIHAAEEFDRLRHTAGLNALGITVETPRLDLAQTVRWKDGIVGRLNSGVLGLLRKAKVKIVHGAARFRDGKTVEVETETGTQLIRAETVVIATGSEPVELPALPFGGAVLSSTGALSLPEVPKSLAVVGGGYIGLELGTAFAKLGARVTVVEAMAQILPQYDGELVKPVAKRLGELGVRVLTGAKAKGYSGEALAVEIAGKEERIAADKVLVTVGRRPRTEGWGLEELDLDRAGRFIRIDEHCRTSMRGVYAIGDVTGEIVTAGLSPDEARAQGYDIRVGLFPFNANGRAMTTQSEDGFVRAVARADTNLVLGVQAVGAGVSELSSAFSLALEMGARLEDIAGTIHAHPTRSEGLQEAALKALGHALHI